MCVYGLFFLGKAFPLQANNYIIISSLRVLFSFQIVHYNMNNISLEIHIYYSSIGISFYPIFLITGNKRFYTFLQYMSGMLMCLTTLNLLVCPFVVDVVIFVESSTSYLLVRFIYMLGVFENICKGFSNWKPLLLCYKHERNISGWQGGRKIKPFLFLKREMFITNDK